MGSNILNIGKSALFAAQAGLSTTGHNIANASVAGYSRQQVVQKTATAQDMGYGFIGGGTEVAEVKRYYDNFLTTQVRTAQSSKSALDAFHAQISQVDNLLSDTTSGLSPALQDFFAGVQNLASDPASAPAREALLSSSESLAGRFQGLNGRLAEIREGVNSQITANVSVINSFARQIANLNDSIGDLSAAGNTPNDLLDQRDQLISDLNKQVKTTVVPGGNNSLTVSIGNGQPLVVGSKAFALAAAVSTTDPTRVEVGYVIAGKTTVLAESALTGGELGGMFDFRANSLDRAQNSLGRIAISLADTFNQQHKLGVDQTGALGKDFFAPAQVAAVASSNNSGSATVTAKVTDASKLTVSDYKLEFDGSKYSVTRQPNGTPTPITKNPQVVDGVEYTTAGSAAMGDSFVIRPTYNGAADFKVAITDRKEIAAAAAVLIKTGNGATNSGTGKINEGSVDVNYLGKQLSASAPLTLNFAGSTLTGFPPGQDVTVTGSSGKKVYTASTATPPVITSIPYEPGATLSFGGITVAITGAPRDGDKFTIGPNTGAQSVAVGDNRNARALGALQTTRIMDGGTATYQSSYAELVSFVGNKTREVQVNSAASTALLAQSREAQQSVSGVNLDEEAANLLHYQQAYQAAGKVMQIASQLFDVLLSLGR
jgi:flagellar hook-associated protein 1